MTFFSCHLDCHVLIAQFFPIALAIVNNIINAVVNVVAIVIS